MSGGGGLNRHERGPYTGLSGDEVARRLEGGAAIEVAPVRRRRLDARRQIARDTATILSGAILAILVFRVAPGMLGGPGASPTPGETEIVTGSDGPVDTGAAIGTLPPPATIGPVVNPSANLDATPTPIVIQTLGPTTVTVIVNVKNDNGGNDRASDWQISVSGANASPSSFSGSEGGTTVVLKPDATFKITTSPKTAGGYAESRSGKCGGSIGKGYQMTCVITENDKPVHLTVVVKVGGPAAPSDVDVTVTGGHPSPASFTGTSGTLVTLDANAAWSVAAALSSPDPDYFAPTFSSGCSDGNGAREGATSTCTIEIAPKPPIAAFSCNPTGGGTLEVSFTNESTHLQTSWSWDFGDGSPAGTTQNPTYTYAVGGDYLVTLTVFGPGGSDSLSKTCTAS
jgi:PKD repeat protein